MEKSNLSLVHRYTNVTIEYIRIEFVAAKTLM